MKLILQSPTADNNALRRLAATANPDHVIDLGPGAIRCEGQHIAPDDHLAQQAFESGIDVFWNDSDRRLSDFKLLAMDMDSTLITIECIDEIADMQGLKPQVSAITEMAMRGELAFTDSLIRRVALLKGLPEAALQQVYEQRLKLSPGAHRMLEAMRGAGLKTLLVSGGFTFFTERIKDSLGLDFTQANQLEVRDGKLTGQVLGTIVDAEEKRRSVERSCASLGIAPSQTIVMGDGANDLAMMSIAGLSVAFRAKPVVRKQANVALNFVGLDGVLNLF